MPSGSKELNRAYCLAHKARHPKRLLHRARVQKANAKARSMGLRADLTLDEWLEIVDDYENQCAYCLGGKSESLDHIIPLAKGGPTTKVNVAPACMACNRAKKSPDWTPSITSRHWPFDNTLIGVEEALRA